MKPEPRNLLLAAFISFLAIPAGLRAQVKPETQHDFDCYIQSAEARMDARKPFVLADADSALNQKLVRGQKIETIAANGVNPHKLAGGQLYDWIGTVFIPGGSLDRLIRMLQDYDHRPQFFPETISTSKLLCRTGENHFRYTMQLKEPAVIDVESDVVWERVDQHRWRCRSYSTHTSEVGKDHGYLRRLYSYWRFEEGDKGIYVESETITLSDEFGSMARTFGSMLLGINPEKSLRHSLASMRESVLKPGLEIPTLPAGLAACGEAVRPGGCAVAGTQ
ncbi:conserved exported hypothetical protein [Candidatus Sulfopaludibacter sp. SbA6]|nr:conserved exported hypothetical protein [Candidatus Sulfopaludibacter sp. SbA6]